MRFISKILPYSIYKLLKKLQLKYRITKYRDSEIKIVLGAGGVFQEGWIPTNIETINIPVENDWKKFFNENSISMIMAEHVWEHLSIDDSNMSLKIISKFLKKGGHIRIAVPDGFHPDPEYIQGVDASKDPEDLNIPDSHKILYNYQSLRKLFENAGFKVLLLEYFDENGLFHFNPWDPEKGLIYRSERFKFLRKDISILNMPNFSSLIIDAIKE